jgi:hypothetical protein
MVLASPNCVVMCGIRITHNVNIENLVVVYYLRLFEAQEAQPRFIQKHCTATKV